MRETRVGVDPHYQWAINREPDFLVIQPAPMPVTGSEPAFDGIRDAFREAGFVPAYGSANPTPVATEMIRFDDMGSQQGRLTVTLPHGASDSWAIPHGDPVWAHRVRNDGEVLVLVTQAALDEEGTLSQASMDRDVQAGVVLVAKVAVSTT